MKSLTAVCQTGASMPAINPNGRISRHPPHRGDGENAEMKMYLSKLKDLVPFMPKNRKLSKLEIIQHVIDYICDLQSELETHPEINNFDASAALSFATNNFDRISSETATATTDEEMHEEEEESVSSSLQERLNAPEQQQQSSPAQYHQRQPLVECQTPNTILPPATQHQQHHQQQQRQMNASNLVQQNGSSSSVTTTTTSSSQSLTTVATVPSATVSFLKSC